MNRAELETYIREAYDTLGEQPWMQYPTYTVFRHAKNKKWFAVIMDLPREKLGFSGHDAISVVNLKCDTRLIGSFREEAAFFRMVITFVNERKSDGSFCVGNGLSAAVCPQAPCKRATVRRTALSESQTRRWRSAQNSNLILKLGTIREACGPRTSRVHAPYMLG